MVLIRPLPDRCLGACAVVIVVCSCYTCQVAGVTRAIRVHHSQVRAFKCRQWNPIHLMLKSAAATCAQINQMRNVTVDFSHSHSNHFLFTLALMTFSAYILTFLASSMIVSMIGSSLCRSVFRRTMLCRWANPFFHTTSLEVTVSFGCQPFRGITYFTANGWLTMKPMRKTSTTKSLLIKKVYLKKILIPLKLWTSIMHSQLNITIKIWS